jgi:HEAT repeat protein
MLRELARKQEALARSETALARARTDEAYGVLSVRLAELGPPADGPLTRALEDGEPGVRLEALRALARRRVREAAAAVLERLGDEDGGVRAEAARTLGALLGVIGIGAASQGAVAAQAAAALARAAEGDRCARARVEALRALLRLDRARAFAVLAATPAPDDPAALAAARARFEGARRRWGQRAVGQLVPLLAHASGAARRGAAATLGLTGSQEAVLPLLAVLSDASVTVRLEAARSLGLLGDPRALPGLAGALRDPDHLVRGYAAEALGRLGARAGDTAPLPALTAALVDGAAGVRQHAVAALGRLAERLQELGWPCAPLERQLVIDAIAVAMTDPEARVVVVAARLACGLRDARLVRPLLGALRHPDAFRGVLAPAVAALRALGPVAEGPLVRALHDPDPRLRARVAQVLGALPLPGAGGALMEALADRVPTVRAAAAQALGERREANALGLLLVALRDADPDVCARAALSLGRLRDPRAVPSLVRVLCDVGATLRGSAARLERGTYVVLRGVIEALGELGDGRALDPLKTALGHADWRVRRDAAEALGRLGDARASDALGRALSDEERLVRRGAASALRNLHRAA